MNILEGSDFEQEEGRARLGRMGTWGRAVGLWGHIKL